jgi:hypothetical protein
VKKAITAEYAGLSIHRRHLIYADLCDSDVAKALHIKIRSPAPLLDLCRALVEAGVDPTTPLEAYRDKTLCLRVRSIGEAAKLKIGGDGVSFRPVPEPVTASPMRSRRTGARRAA